MAVRSSGILLYRLEDGLLSVWLGHMGGPYWAKKDLAAWSIPKGEVLPGEDDLTAALREFEEETGILAPAVAYDALGDFRQSSGKTVTVFAARSDLEIDELASNTFELEWPPHSGRIQSFPELDAGEWFAVEAARTKIVKGQLPVLDSLERLVAGA